MTARHSRRGFLAQTSIGTASLGLGGLAGVAKMAPASAAERKSTPIDFQYLSKGLNALARAHRVSAMAGHSGAAVVAGYFVGVQNPDLDHAVYDGIEENLNRIIRGESVFGRGKTAALFEPFPKENPNENLIDGIAEALAGNISKPRESGHNVIFAAIAIRALKEHPELATPSVTDGIRTLIAKFNHAHPGSGYYGKEKGRIYGHKVRLPQDDAFPPYSSLEAMATAVIDELLQQTPEHRRRGYGGLVHINNHAAALSELAQYGYRDLVAKGLIAHHQHMQLWRTLPNVVEEIGRDIPPKYDPRTKAYWDSEKKSSKGAQLTHRVKTLYGFDELVELIKDDAKRKEANDKLRYLM